MPLLPSLPCAGAGSGCSAATSRSGRGRGPWAVVFGGGVVIVGRAWVSRAFSLSSTAPGPWPQPTTQAKRGKARQGKAAHAPGWRRRRGSCGAPRRRARWPWARSSCRRSSWRRPRPSLVPVGRRLGGGVGLISDGGSIDSVGRWMMLFRLTDCLPFGLQGHAVADGRLSTHPTPSARTMAAASGTLVKTCVSWLRLWGVSMGVSQHKRAGKQGD